MDLDADSHVHFDSLCCSSWWQVAQAFDACMYVLVLLSRPRSFGVLQEVMIVKMMIMKVGLGLLILIIIIYFNKFHMYNFFPFHFQFALLKLVTTN